MEALFSSRAAPLAMVTQRQSQPVASCTPGVSTTMARLAMATVTLTGTQRPSKLTAMANLSIRSSRWLAVSTQPSRLMLTATPTLGVKASSAMQRPANKELPSASRRTQRTAFSRMCLRTMTLCFSTLQSESMRSAQNVGRQEDAQISRSKVPALLTVKSWQSVSRMVTCQKKSLRISTTTPVA